MPFVQCTFPNAVCDVQNQRRTSPFPSYSNPKIYIPGNHNKRSAPKYAAKNDKPHSMPVLAPMDLSPVGDGVADVKIRVGPSAVRLSGGSLVGAAAVVVSVEIPISSSLVWVTRSEVFHV